MTNVWIANAFVIELIAVAGVVGVALTNRTKAGFAAGFNTMLVVTVVYVIGSPPFNPNAESEPSSNEQRR